MPEEFDDEEEELGEEQQFLDSDEHNDTHAEHVMKIRIGNEEEDVYTEEGREELVEDDEIEPWEEGFSEGAKHEGELGECAHCHEPLGDRDEVHEKKYHDEIMFFCSEECANAGPSKK